MSAESKGIAVGPSEGNRIRSPIGGDITFIVRGEQSNGALAALEAAAPPGEGPPLHLHTREDGRSTSWRGSSGGSSATS